jgi:uncharacterized protein
MNPISAGVQRLLIGVVRAYQLLLSPWIGGQCRFTPTCSAYALQALEQHGAWRGGALSMRRIARCGPWCEGGHDPVPNAATRQLFTSLLNSPTATQSVDEPSAPSSQAS